MSRGVAVPAERGVVRLEEGLPLESEEEIRPCRVGFEVVGPADAPVVVVLGGISADRHVASSAADPEPGWWEPVFGPGAGLDPTRFRILGMDWIGGPGRSSAPGTAPSPEGIPAVTTGDQAASVAAVLDHLGVERVRGFVGASYGAMAGLAFGARYPERVEAVLAISGAHESHPMATALRVLQRRIVLFGQEVGREGPALETARGLAMTTYRTEEEFRRRFGGPPRLEGTTYRFPVEDYLEHHGRKFAERFRAGHFLYLCQSLDLHSVEPEAIRVPVTLVSVDPDTLVPRWQMEELHGRLAGPAELVPIRSLYGHDAFLKEEERISAVLREFLADHE